MPQVKAVSRSKSEWSQVKKSLRENFHFKELRPGQEEIIRSVLARKNTLAIMPTGAGKSLCYQLPALQLDGTTIIISPLISLMKDQRESVEGRGISAVELNSTLKASDRNQNLETIENDAAEMLYVTPERFSNPDFLKSMKSHLIDFVVIDEAHCVSQWGHDFRPAYLSIGESIKKLGSPPVLALTATATEEVAKDIQAQLGFKEMEVFRSSVLRDNLQFEAKYLNTPKEKKEALLKLVNELREESGIIYTATVKAAKEIHDYLAEHEIPSILYHGKLKAKEREENQNEFMNHTPRLMIATNAFGMGIDKANIRFVIHFQFPASLEAYYQEAGRAGRDGKPARCILLYLRRDKSTQALFLSGRYPTETEVSKVYNLLQTLHRKSESIDRVAIENKLKDIIHSKKNAVIFALLKNLIVIKETKKDGLVLLKPSLSDAEIAELAAVYQKRSLRDKSKLDQVIQYAQSALCRWRNILHYFDEAHKIETCEHCDNCLSPSRKKLQSIASSLS